jgi:hypothetical protein
MEPIITNDDEKKVYPNIEENEYRSCCFRCDKELVKYLTAISISYIILGLSIYKLIIINGSNEDTSIYISLITLILGIFTNPIKLKTNNELTNTQTAS